MRAAIREIITFAVVILALLLFQSVSALSQSTWYVPDDFPAGIQSAISSPNVVNGDTIVVRAGTYVENIDHSPRGEQEGWSPLPASPSFARALLGRDL